MITKNAALNSLSVESKCDLLATTRPFVNFPVWSAGQIYDSAEENSPAGPIFFW